MARTKARSTEPRPVPDLFVTAVSVDGTSEYVRLTGWVAHSSALAPATEGAERRMVDRMVMPRSSARDLHAALSRLLGRGNGG